MLFPYWGVWLCIMKNGMTQLLLISRCKVWDTRLIRVIIFLERIRREESTGFVDYLTISSSLLFSGKYARNIGELGKLNFYNNIRLSDYSCEGYLDGLEVVCCDYRELTDKYRDSPDVVFLIDPPYMATDISTYRMD